MGCSFAIVVAAVVVAASCCWFVSLRVVIVLLPTSAAVAFIATLFHYCSCFNYCSPSITQKYSICHLSYSNSQYNNIATIVLYFTGNQQLSINIHTTALCNIFYNYWSFDFKPVYLYVYLFLLYIQYKRLSVSPSVSPSLFCLPSRPLAVVVVYCHCYCCRTFLFKILMIICVCICVCICFSLLNELQRFFLGSIGIGTQLLPYILTYDILIYLQTCTFQWILVLIVCMYSMCICKFCCLCIVNYNK